MTLAIVDGTFTAVDQESDILVIHDGFKRAGGDANLFNLVVAPVSGDDIDGTVELQRSFDKGSTWHTTDTLTEKYGGRGLEPETNVWLKLVRTEHTSDVRYRLSAR